VIWEGLSVGKRMQAPRVGQKGGGEGRERADWQRIFANSYILIMHF